MEMSAAFWLVTSIPDIIENETSLTDFTRSLDYRANLGIQDLTIFIPVSCINVGNQ